MNFVELSLKIVKRSMPNYLLLAVLRSQLLTLTLRVSDEFS
jgi:hypothetical protein